MNFKYLGVNITSNRNLGERVKAQTKRHIQDMYKTSNAIETRAEIAVTNKFLRTTEMRTLRSMAGYTVTRK